MKKMIIFYYIIAAILLCHIAEPVFAEETPAPPPEHKRKVFVDEKEKNIYWPMSMPFWVKLTTSPDPDAPSYLLEKVNPKSTVEVGQYMKDGIKLEITGQQFIRWYNVVTNETCFLKFFADGDAPVTESFLKEAPTSKTGEHIFYGKNLKFSLASKDDVSGVDTVYSSIDGKDFTPYTSELSFDAEKDYFIRYYSVDRVGYAEVPKILRFTVDTTPPDTSIQSHSNFLDTVLSTSTTLQLTAADKLAGVQNIFYRIDAQPQPTTYSGAEIKLTDLPDGQHQVEYFSIDNVQNPENKKIFSFYLDRIPPETSSEFVGDHFHNEKGIDFISPRTKIKLMARDNKIGVEQIDYAFQEGKYQVYSEPFLTPYPAGDFVVTYRATDKLKNMGSVVKIPVHLDNKPPVSTYSIKGPKFEQRDTTWITSVTSVSLSATDDAAGVKDIYFQLGQKSEYKTYTEPISIAEENRYLFKFYAKDRVENQETEQPYIIIVDNTPPTLTKTFSVPKSGTQPGKDGKEIDVYPRYTSLFFGAIDNSAGIAGIWYTLNGGKEQVYSTPLMFKEEGEFSMNIRLADNVGNSASESVRFIIKD